MTAVTDVTDSDAPTAAATTRGTDPTTGRGAGWRLAVLPALVLLAGGLARLWIADDGLINVRIVETLADGHGPTFTAGVRAETATSPVWALLLAAVRITTGLPADAVAVWAGLTGSVAGIALAGRAALDGATRRAGGPGWAAWPLPIGLLGYSVVGFAWDFASSGLENGVVTLWLGAVALVLRRTGVDRAGSRRGRAVLFGLGPLLRPDLALVSGVLLLAELRRPGPTAAAKVRALAWAAALPVAAQVVRMAVYAVLVPTTGLAKEGTSLRPAQGLEYLTTSLSASGAWVLVLVVAGAVLAARRSGDGPPRPAPTAAPGPRWSTTLAVGGALHLTYVVVVGGDFMVGRLLLPGLLLLATAVGAVPLPTLPRHRLVVAAGLAVYALAALAADRPMTGDIADERAVYTRFAEHAHPISAADHADSAFARVARARLAEAGPGTLVLLPPDIDGPTIVMPLAPEVAARYDNVLVTPVLGIMAATAGPDVAVLDPIGLSDPVAAHQELLVRGKPGHEKWLAAEWYAARFADLDAPLAPELDPERVDAATRALGCGTLAELVEATTADLTWDRAWANVGASARLTTFRFHPDPILAEEELC